MIKNGTYRNEYDGMDLIELMPFDVFGAENEESEKAVYWLNIIQEVIFENSSEIGDLFSNVLQIGRERFFDESAEMRYIDIKDSFLFNYIQRILPSYHHKFIEQLNYAELEIFAKSYLFAQDNWGKPNGIIQLIKSILETSVSSELKVRIQDLNGELVNLPYEMCSFLGRKTFTLGSDLILGSKIYKKSSICNIFVGPISKEHLKIFNDNGWAINNKGSNKLNYLAEMALPYYLNPIITFLLHTKEFKLGYGRLNHDNLGRVQL